MTGRRPWGVPPVRAVAMLTLLLMLSCPALMAQKNQSQRQLSTPDVPQRPLEQLRLILQQQQLSHPQQIPSPRDLQNSLNLSDDQMKILKEALIKSGMLPPALSVPSTREQPESPQDTLRKLQDLQRQLANRRQEETGERTPFPEDGRPSRSTNSDNDSAADSPANNPALSRRPRPERDSPRSSRSTASAPSEPSPDRRQPRNTDDESSRPSSPAAGQGNRMTDAQPDSDRRGFQRRQSAQTPNGTGRETASGASSDAGFDISKELSRRGLRKTLGRLVHDVRRQLQEESTDQPGDTETTPSPLRKALVEVVDTVRRDVVETIQESRNRQSPRDSSESPTGSGRASSRSSVMRNSNPPATDTATDTATATDSAAPADSSPGLISSLTDNFPDQEALVPTGSSWQLLLILAVVGMIAIAYLLSSRHQARQQRHQRGRRLPPVRPDQIRTREDVIRAFHWLIQCQSPDAADWWNHLQAGEALAEQSQARDESLQQMVQLYELARYDRANEAFEQTHVQQARTALAGCLS